MEPFQQVAQNEHLRKKGRGWGHIVAFESPGPTPIQAVHWRQIDANTRAEYVLHHMTMRSRRSNAVFVLLLALGAICATGAAVYAKDKPLSWKPIQDALLRVNDAPPKEWAAYRTGKKNDPLVLQIGSRFLLIQARGRQIFELDPSKIERKPGELLWSLADRPAKPLAASDWVVDDIGAAFVIKVKLASENALVDLQLPHPPDVGSLPDRPPQQERRRRDYFSGVN
jgi:hypothetical protein